MKIKDFEQTYKSGAGCLILSKNTNNFLLIQRSQDVPAPLTWSLPGGRVEFNEKPEIAARRELYEEIGINLNDRPFKLIYTNETHAPRFRFYTYACVIKEELSPKLNWESSDYIWCDMSTLPNPLHWGLSQLLTNEAAGLRLKKFLDGQKVFDK